MAGTAAVLKLGFTHTVYELEDLSFGGACIRGGPPPPAFFALLLRLSSGFVDVEAHVVRGASRDERGPRWGVAFDRLTAGAAQAMDRALRRARRA